MVEMVQEGKGDDAQEHPLAAGEPPPRATAGLLWLWSCSLLDLRKR
jgi:hypothetical protein